MPRDQQMLLAFRETQPDKPVETIFPSRSVEEIAAELRPRLLAYLTAVDHSVGLRELRTELGHSTLDTDTDQLGTLDDRPRPGLAER